MVSVLFSEAKIGSLINSGREKARQPCVITATNVLLLLIRGRYSVIETKPD